VSLVLAGRLVLQESLEEQKTGCVLLLNSMIVGR
jgi:hypothetical protein